MEPRQPSPSAGDMRNIAHHIPSESELVLLSLDYLRDLRRAYANKEDLLRGEGLDADWLTLAIFALNRSFSRTKSDAMSSSLYLDNDAWRNDSHPVDCSLDRLPSLQQMTDEVVYGGNPSGHGNADASLSGVHPNPTMTMNEPQDDDLDAFAWYEYDDAHPSNQQRYFLLNGMGGGVRGPLMLGEIAAAGLHQLQARTRHDAEKEIIESPLFEQFLQAVKSKGFFDDTENETPLADPIQDQQRLLRKEAYYQSRFEKVVSKFRTKLAFKADPSGESDTANLSDAQYSRRLRNCMAVRKNRHDEAIGQNFSTATRLQPGSTDPQDIQEAERMKNVGNAHMQRKDYPAAADAYTHALRLAPAGPNSHVYFSNRAAALLSMKRFTDAISDSERSLALKPDYGKAHARLGLAHFLLGDYRPAMEAYALALNYEPDNKSSRSYLEKAQKRLAKQEDQTTIGASFSVVSEWDRSHPLSTVDSKLNAALPTPTSADTEHRAAEKAKILGNQLMAQRQYQQAVAAYSRALQYSPDGAQSHVYYSNRAAALCYLERYEEAAQDSQTSLQLKPDYGKAHARLGLSRFFMEDYPGAIQAYTAALKYDPNNAASKSYLAKAKLKWDQQDNHVASPVNNERPLSLSLDTDARRLLNDPDMQTMAKKAMATTPTSGSQLLEDPEMIRIARKAVNDPTMMAAVKAAVNH